MSKCSILGVVDHMWIHGFYAVYTSGHSRDIVGYSDTAEKLNVVHTKSYRESHPLKIREWM
jgi:hypothetical protein